ncbi:MAG: DUF4190 domain-containing protein [Planctomycetota bacterium]
MSTNPYAQPGPYDQVGTDTGVPMEPRRTSVLAVLSLVCSLICCIPGTGLLGVFIGVVAVILIGASGGRVGGRGLAFAGIVVGLAISAVWLLIGIGMAGLAGQFSNYAVIAETMDADDRDAFIAEMNPYSHHLITEEVFIDFGDAVADEWGAYQGPVEGLGEVIGAYMEQSTQLQSIGQQPGPGVGLLPVPVEFDNGRALMLMVIESSNPSTNNSGLPMPLNVGFPDQAGQSMIWLLDSGLSIPPAAPTTPQTPSATGEGEGGEGAEATGDDSEQAPSEGDAG